MSSIGLVGGTFEFFHIGHQKLIDSCLSNCDILEIWVLSEKIARQKDSRISSWKERCELIKQELSHEQNSRITFHELLDDFGIAISHEKADKIFCTTETLSTCQLINKKRIENGLIPLSIVIVQHALSEDGGIISSSRIRDGEINRDGKAWIRFEDINSNLYLTKEVESMLKDPFGKLFTGPEENHSIAITNALNFLEDFHLPIIGVGDVTVRALQNIDSPASIGVIDEKTKRVKWDGYREINQSLYDNVIKCENPPGVLTRSLFESCEQAIFNWTEKNETTLILVNGEEDLAPLFLHIIAPMKSAIIYGQPTKGVVVRITGLDSKMRCQKILSLCERNSN
jgi:pantetheine-phosphate adenylyltransferase